MGTLSKPIMEFMAGVATNVLADGVSSVIGGSLGKKDKTAECKERLAIQINLARATTWCFSKAQFTIENEYVINYKSDLIIAADEGERVLGSPTANAKEMERALSKLANLTSELDRYVQLFNLERRAATCAIKKFPATAVWCTYDNPNPDLLFDSNKSEEGDAPNSFAAPGNPGASQQRAFYGEKKQEIVYLGGPCKIPSLEEKKAAVLAPRQMFLDTALGSTYDNPNPDPLFDSNKLEEGDAPNSFGTTLLAALKRPLNTALGSTYDNPNPDPLFDSNKSEEGDAPNSFAALGNPGAPQQRAFYGEKKLEMECVNPYRKIPVVDVLEIQQMLSYKSKESYPVVNSPKLITGRISKKQKLFIKNMKALRSMGLLYPEGTGFLSGAIKDCICKELLENPYDYTNRGLIHNSGHSINGRKKMKGKYPEYEFDEQTGYGKANMPTCSCFPSSSSGGAGNHIFPSFEGTPDEQDERAGDVLKSFDGIPE